MKHIKKILVVVAMVLISAGVWKITRQDNNNQNVESAITEVQADTEESNVLTNVDPKEVEEYEMVYKNPYVVYLRRAIDSYSAGDWKSNGISEAAVTGIEMDGITSGLDSFDKEYFKSKFWVATIDSSVAGGKDIQIIFKDRPDKMFYAWVYKLNTDGEEFELRGFNSRDDVSAEELSNFLEFYAPLLERDELSI